MPTMPPIIRVCPEHLNMLFNGNRLWERAQAGELQYKITKKRKEKPLIDHRNNVCPWTELLDIVDSRYPAGDPRYDVVIEANRHLTDDGTIGGSGKWDASKASVQIDGKVYRKFKTKGGRDPRCELCEGGDMIPPDKRYLDSEYKP